ncbi:MAG: nucleotide exchange factor GrpE [Oxalobacter sp.]|nr:nucleotide exchange factor GrpE [Oxalobacter sp.]
MMIGNIFSSFQKDSSNDNPSETSNIDLDDSGNPGNLSGTAPLTASETDKPLPETESLPTEETVSTPENPAPVPATEETTEPIPETVTTDTAPSETEVLKQELADIKASLAALQESFDQKIKTDAKKNEQFDRLHDELQDYRNGTFEKNIDAIALEIIRLIDELGNDANFYKETAETDGTAKALYKKTDDLRQELLDILYRQSIEPYQDKSEELDSHRQTNVQTVITEEAEKHRKIAERVADGYEKNGRVIRKERVKVYRAVPSKNETNNQPDKDWKAS